MEKETIEVDDVREVVKLIQEYRPKVTYFTQYEFQDGYSQTNETILGLMEESNFDEGVLDECIDEGEYKPGKTIYNDTVYQCEINILKLDSFIDLLNHYIELQVEENDDWSCETFFEWFHPLDGDYPETELRNQIFDKDKWNHTLGYNEFENNDITWCCGTNNFNYHGINIDNIEINNKVFSFYGCWDDYNGE